MHDMPQNFQSAPLPSSGIFFIPALTVIVRILRRPGEMPSIYAFCIVCVQIYVSNCAWPCRRQNPPKQLSDKLSKINALLRDKIESQFSAIPAHRKFVSENCVSKTKKIEHAPLILGVDNLHREFLRAYFGLAELQCLDLVLCLRRQQSGEIPSKVSDIKH